MFGVFLRGWSAGVLSGTAAGTLYAFVFGAVLAGDWRNAVAGCLLGLVFGLSVGVLVGLFAGLVLAVASPAVHEVWQARLGGGVSAVTAALALVASLDRAFDVVLGVVFRGVFLALCVTIGAAVGPRVVFGRHASAAGCRSLGSRTWRPATSARAD